MTEFNVSSVAKAAGLPTKTVRYYADIGLIEPARGPNGYRLFDAKDLHRLRFVARARALGFTVEDCRTLLALYNDEGRTSAEVKEIAERHLEDIEEKIEDLQSMHRTLGKLVASCDGDSRPDCPILEGLSPD